MSRIVLLRGTAFALPWAILLALLRDHPWFVRVGAVIGVTVLALICLPRRAVRTRRRLRFIRWSFIANADALLGWMLDRAMILLHVFYACLMVGLFLYCAYVLMRLPPRDIRLPEEEGAPVVPACTEKAPRAKLVR